MRLFKTFAIAAGLSLSLSCSAAAEGPVYALWVVQPGAHKGRTVYLGGDPALLRDRLQSAVWEAGAGSTQSVAARIVAPSPSPEVDAIAQALVEAGVDPRYVAVSYTSGPQYEIKISLWLARAFGDCSFSPEFFETLWSRSSGNAFEPAIGCDSRSNLHAMLSNKRDLVAGRGTRYSDGARPALAVKQWRSGKLAQQPAANGNGVAKPVANE